MATKLGFEATLDAPWEKCIETVTQALQKEGFGILTRIDVHKAFQEKIGKTFRPYVILGACNPQLAHQALTSQAEVGLMLPCNVTVEATSEKQTLVRIVDPEIMMQTGDLGMDPQLVAVAKDAKQRLLRVASALSAGQEHGTH